MLEFENQSYSVNTKNEPEVPVLRLHYPEEYNSMPLFPINVTVHEINGSAYGKSCIYCVHTTFVKNLSIYEASDLEFIAI